MLEKYYIVVITPKDENDTSIEIDTRNVYTTLHDAWESLREFVIDSLFLDIEALPQPKKLEDCFHEFPSFFISIWRSDVPPHILGTIN